ncbi:hypothetical protein LINPERHAP1_LOCUS25901 [Linum perenne]
MLSGSPRFDAYGVDFGWGKLVAVRSGWGNFALTVTPKHIQFSTLRLPLHIPLSPVIRLYARARYFQLQIYTSTMPLPSQLRRRILHHQRFRHRIGLIRNFRFQNRTRMRPRPQRLLRRRGGASRARPALFNVTAQDDFLL